MIRASICHQIALFRFPICRSLYYLIDARDVGVLHLL